LAAVNGKASAQDGTGYMQVAFQQAERLMVIYL